MSDPKTFTGAEYTFTLYESDVRPGVIVRHKQAPLDHGQWISLTDLLAFVAWRGAASELSVVELEATSPAATGGNGAHLAAVDGVLVGGGGGKPYRAPPMRAGIPRCGICKDTGMRPRVGGGLTRCDCDPRWRR